MSRDDAPTAGPLAAARRAFDKGDLAAAARHVASALGEDPNRSDALGLLDEILAAADDPADLIASDELPATSGLAAVHAYILADQGRIPEAIDKLLGVITDRPDVLYIDWVLGWLQRPESAGKLDLDKLAAFVGNLVEQYPALTAPHGGGRDTLSRMPLFIQLVRRTQSADAHFLVVATALLRRLGNLDEALKLAREAHTLEPDVQTALAVAATHANRNELELALKAFQEALRLEPTDTAARVNMADLLVHHERLDEALAQYDEVLEREPNQEDAQPSVLFLRFVHGGGEEYREQLLALADEQPDNERARRLALQVTPYVGHLPDPPDVSASLRPPDGDEDEGRGWLPHLEAPSNFLAFDWLRRMGPKVTRVQQPDPRLPRCRVDYLLWKYDGTQPVVALPPSSKAAQAIAEVAAQPFQIDAWWGHARRAAQQFTADDVEDVLATMVYPPGVGGMDQPARWVYRVQMAAALVAAHLDGGWEGTVRRKALLSLANGPMDWTVDAGLVALVGVAREEEDAAPEITRLFRDLRAAVPDDGTYCTLPAVLWCSLRLPGLSDDDRDDIRQRLRRWNDTREADHHRRQATMHAGRGELEKAIESLTQTLRLAPDGAAAYRERASLLLRRNNARGAVDDYSKAIELEPGAAGDHLGRGQAQLKLGRFEQAIADLSEALRLAPWDWQPWYRRGLARVARKQFEQAIEDFSEVIRLAPEQPEGYQQRAFVRTQLGQFDGAVTDWTALIERNPESPPAYSSRGRLHLRRGDHRGAVADFLKASELDPANANTHSQLAWVWATCPEAAVRDGPRAVEHATKACELTEWQKAFCLDALAAACAEAGRFDEAVRHAEQAAASGSDSERPAFFTRLEAYRQGRPWRES